MFKKPVCIESFFTIKLENKNRTEARKKKEGKGKKTKRQRKESKKIRKESRKHRGIGEEDEPSLKLQVRVLFPMAHRCQHNMRTFHRQTMGYDIISSTSTACYEEHKSPGRDSNARHCSIPEYD